MDIFMTAAERYGFLEAKVGEIVTIKLDPDGEPVSKIRSHISSHGAYWGKRFKTSERDGTLYVKRIK